MKRYFLTLSSFLLFCCLSHAQQLNFQIEKDGFVVGNAQLWIATEQDQQTYALQLSDMECFPFEVSHVTANYQAGILASSATSGSSYIYTKAEQGYLHVMEEGNYKPIKNEGVATSLTKLLAEEPTTELALMESNGKILPIQKIGRNMFQVVLSKDVNLIFSYQNGLCSSVQIQQEDEHWKMTLVNKLTL